MSSRCFTTFWSSGSAFSGSLLLQLDIREVRQSLRVIGIDRQFVLKYFLASSNCVNFHCR